jgi:hypothetical protein
MKKRVLLLICLSGVCHLTSCSTPQESVTTEHKGKTLIVHHRQHTNGGLVDRIEAINSKGVVSQAEIHVFDVGRYVDASGNLHEAHQMYRVAQSSHPILMLPKGTHPSGPRTVYTPPNYTPLPKDQRINDAVSEANKAKEKLEAAQKQVEQRLNEDNNLRGALQDQIDENERLKAQIEAGMSTRHSDQAPQTDAEKAAAAAVDPLVQWGKGVQQ